MKILNTEIVPLGLGCWPIGGPMFTADGESVGYTNTNDRESLNAIQAALANGITLFDTAAAYGAGHAERLLAKGLKNHPDAMVATKIGIEINEQTKTLTKEDPSPQSVQPAIDQCLKRLERDSIDLLLLHLNSLPVDQAGLLFDEMENARLSGKIKSYGWSTDYTANAEAMAERDGFIAVEHAMNVLLGAPAMQETLRNNELLALIRSPLAMGLLGGQYNASSTIPSDDVRASNHTWRAYYIDGKPNPDYLNMFNSIRELIRTGGRTTAQGALAWLWAKSPNNIPIPGARTVAQVEGLAAALAFGPLPADTMTEIDKLVGGKFDCDGVSDR